MANDSSPSSLRDALAGSEPFDLTTFLAGHTRAEGVFEDRFGRLKRRLFVDMHGAWKGGRFHLEEHFTYDDGRREERIWIVVPGEGGNFTATCDDCIGIARGHAADGTITMHYRFRLRMKSRVITVDFADRIHRLGPGRAVNRATMSKLGVRLGELALFFERPDRTAA